MSCTIRYRGGLTIVAEFIAYRDLQVIFKVDGKIYSVQVKDLIEVS